jgi:hypothetical protein
VFHYWVKTMFENNMKEFVSFKQVTTKYLFHFTKNDVGEWQGINSKKKLKIYKWNHSKRFFRKYLNCFYLLTEMVKKRQKTNLKQFWVFQNLKFEYLSEKTHVVKMSIWQDVVDQSYKSFLGGRLCKTCQRFCYSYCIFYLINKVDKKKINKSFFF